MSHLYFEQSSFDRDIKELKDNFNYAVNEKVSYLAAVTNFHGYSHSDLLSFFANKLPQYLDALYYAYADDADGVSPLYNLARIMVLVDSNADQELLHLVSKNESACVYTFIALKNNFDQSDIKSLMGEHIDYEIIKEKFPDNITQKMKENNEDENALIVENAQENLGNSARDIEKQKLEAQIKDIQIKKDACEAYFGKGLSESQRNVLDSLSPNVSYSQRDVAELIALAENGASRELLTSVADRTVLYEQAYIALQYKIDDNNIVDMCIQREKNEISAREFMLSGNGIRNRNDVQSIINKEQQNLLDSHSVKEHGMKLIADMPGMKSISYYMSSILENSEMIYSYNTPENIYGSRDIAQLFTLS